MEAEDEWLWWNIFSWRHGMKRRSCCQRQRIEQLWAGALQKLWSTRFVLPEMGKYGKDIFLFASNIPVSQRMAQRNHIFNKVKFSTHYFSRHIFCLTNALTWMWQSGYVYLHVSSCLWFKIGLVVLPWHASSSRKISYLNPLSYSQPCPLPPLLLLISIPSSSWS